jgi:serine/threonine protein kinase
LVGQVAGCGVTSVVKIGRLRGTNETHALKFVVAKEIRRFQRERAMLEALANHPYVIGLHGASGEECDGEERTHVLFLEHAKRGELFDLLVRLGPFSETITRTYARQLLLALDACHTLGFAHRDVKPENVLVQDDWTLRLADFGFCSNAWSDEAVGTDGYMSPEMASMKRALHRYSFFFADRDGKEEEKDSLVLPRHDHRKTDVWSLGVILFTCLVGHPPLQKATNDDWHYRAMAKSRWPQFWDAHERFYSHTISPEAKQFIQRFFVIPADERPTPAELLADPWMEDTVFTDAELAQAMESLPHFPDYLASSPVESSGDDSSPPPPPPPPSA